MSPLKDPEDRDEATALINQYASSDSCRFIYTKHCDQRVLERAIPHDVLVATLTYGNVVRIDTETCPFTGDLRYAYRVELRDREGRVTVVTAIPGYNRLRIVTTFAD